uniref:Free fatty acid receptor 2-like n=1 Tax=Lepisosteus oculatus TaxID=7918 RepID=W5NMB9_LEPOC
SNMAPGQLEHKDYLFLTVYSLTLLLGLPSNILVLAAFVNKARTEGTTPNVVYVINLCLANLVFVLWLPIKIVETLKSWTLPALLCPIYNFFHFSTIYASTLFLTSISVGRYLSIAFPISYKLYKKAKNSCFVCVFFWAIVITHVALVLTVQENDEDLFISSSADNTSTCYNNFTKEQLDFLAPLRLEMAVVLFFIPLLVTSFCYFRCIALVVRSCLHTRRKRRVIRVAVSTLIVFVVCFAPYNFSHVVGFIRHENVEWRGEALLTSTCNVFLEPIIMFFLSSSTEHRLNHCCQLPRET